MAWGKTQRWRPIRQNINRCGLSLALVGALMCTTAPAWAVSRLGGQTDDSVCDAGSTAARSREWPITWDFVKARCKNGQVLLGSSIESATGGFEIEGMAKSFCRIADIQLYTTAGNLAGLPVRFGHVRCKIEKLPE